jgi:hypothetical protein
MASKETLLQVKEATLPLLAAAGTSAWFASEV